MAPAVVAFEICYIGLDRYFHKDRVLSSHKLIMLSLIHATSINIVIQ